MARKIVITSGKGGVGKTTLVTHLGRKLASTGCRVLLIDGDFGLNNLDLSVGVENKVSYDLLDVLTGKCRIRQALIKDNFEKNLFILPSDRLSVSSSFTATNIKTALSGIGKLFDYVFIDSPAGMDEGFYRAIRLADEVLVVVNSDFSSLRDADKVISAVKNEGIEKVNVIMNKVRGDLLLSGYGIFPKDLEELIKCQVIGVVPETDDFLNFTADKLPTFSRAQKSISILAENLQKGSYRLYDATKNYRGFLGSIKRAIKRSV